MGQRLRELDGLGQIVIHRPLPLAGIDLGDTAREVATDFWGGIALDDEPQQIADRQSEQDAVRPVRVWCGVDALIDQIGDARGVQDDAVVHEHTS